MTPETSHEKQNKLVEIAYFQESQATLVIKSYLFELAFSLLAALILYFLCAWLGIKETMSAILSIGVIFIYLLSRIVYVLCCIERAILWLKDDMNVLNLNEKDSN